MPFLRISGSCLVVLISAAARAASPAGDTAELNHQYVETVRPILQRYCFDCHSSEKHKGDIDFERLSTFEAARAQVPIWEKALELVHSGDMPPKDKPKPNEEERSHLIAWAMSFLAFEARARAGDPGRVVLRRLNNVEYTLTVRDLTGLNLEPAKEFPTDGAAGEGFVNTGNALVMSPSLIDKYLDAAKDIARHVVLLPDGFDFSPGTERGDWVNERLRAIREFYARYTQSDGGQRINLQGIVFDTNTGGRLPVAAYLGATLEEREALGQGAKSIEQVARERGLNVRYLSSLWTLLHTPQATPLLSMLQHRWRASQAADVGALTSEIERWQAALTRFQTVGHMKPWMVPVNPLSTRHEARLKITPPAQGQAVTFYLAVGDAGDGRDQDYVVWQEPRLLLPGRKPLLLRDARSVIQELTAWRARLFASTAASLAAVAETETAANPEALVEAARRHEVSLDAVRAWREYLGLDMRESLHLDYFTNQITRSANYDFVKGWGSPETPNLAANSSDQHVRIPGNMKPHGVVVHPSPTLKACVGWRSPVARAMSLRASITHAHPECGNGVSWSLELRRGATRQRLAAGTSQGGGEVKAGPIAHLPVKVGDLISLLIGPRDGNHACDLTDIELELVDELDASQTWNLTREVSDDILAGNPRADRFGHEGVWHFYTEPVADSNEDRPVIPPGSLLARWLMAEPPEEKVALAQALQTLVLGPKPEPSDAADAVLYAQLTALGGPLLTRDRASDFQPNAGGSPALDQAGAPGEGSWGVDPGLFGLHPNGSPIDSASLCVQAPSLIEVRLPPDLMSGGEFVATAVLDASSAAEGSAQVSVLTERPGPGFDLTAHAAQAQANQGPWGTSPGTVQPEAPILVQESSAARKRFENGFEEFRRWFPAALCYPKIVPVDEVITLTVFHREDEALGRLMLDEEAQATLDRLWHELHFLGQDALTMVDAYGQLMEYATQDSNPKLFEHLRQPIQERAAAFRQELAAAEPNQLDALMAWTARAYRRPVTSEEEQELKALYERLRRQDLSHEEAFRLTLARVLVSPWFLYRAELPATGGQPRPVSDWELANRLSYFLWSSMPDDILRRRAADGSLRDPDVLVGEARRMMQDRRARALATEFACQWLHLRDFDTLDEKSDRLFPTFAELRGDMYEESVRFFEELFRRNGSILDLLDAHHTFLNEALAAHYGIPGVQGPQWRRVDGVRAYGRGGILAMATVLAKQSGAARTSPILRGNWVVETLLGDKLPKPPPNVPQLPEAETETGQLTVRQITERHSTAPECARCHVRIDAFGYALEKYDAIGRLRDKDLAGRDIDDRSHLTWQDDVELDGLPGLRTYLLTRRRADFIRTFCRKLLGYSLGRGLQLSDGPLVEEMETQLAAHGYQFFAAVETILRSQVFRYQRGLEATREEEQ